MSSLTQWTVLAAGVGCAVLAIVAHAVAVCRLAGTLRAVAVLRGWPARAASAGTAALLGAGLAWRIGPHAFVAVVGWLVVITPALVWLDVLEHRLPDALTLGSVPVVAGLTALNAVTAHSIRPVTGAAVGLLLVGGFYLVVALLAAGGGLGAGDVKLAGLVGMVMGARGADDAIVATIIGLAIGAVAGGAVAAYRRNARTLIAFGPAILSGALTTALLDLP